MEEVKLVTYMSKWPVLANLIFPRHHERRLYGNDFKEKIYFEDRDENEHTAQFLFRYIDMVEQRQEEGVDLVDLCCFWTGINVLQTSTDKETMLVKFDSEIELPVVETCFQSMTLPSKYTTFEDFAKHMDIAVKYGSKGFSFS